MDINFIIENIPKYLLYEILSFIIPNIYSLKNIYFKSYKPPKECIETNFNRIYRYCYFNDILLSRKINNYEKIYLSRILKKKNKFRYYISFETKYLICVNCGNTYCDDSSCRINYDIDYFYKSKYLGNNLLSSIIIYFLYVIN
jgi:hypothetical protein